MNSGKERHSRRSAANRILHNKAIAAFTFVMALVVASLPCQAQFTNTGTINGTVVDPTGAAVQGAKVSITNIGTKTVTENVSNSNGRFQQVGLPPGDYEVRVSSPGFDSFLETNIHLEPAGASAVNVVLKPGATATTVTVQGSANQVQTTTNEISNTVSQEEVETLPLNGRNFQQLGSLMPGVINTSPASALLTGGFITSNYLNVNGGGAKGSLYTVDGIWNENTGSMTQTTIMPNPDEIAEVKVLQNNYSAQYSLMGASVVMVQTKSGTEAFHGNAWEFLRNTALNATQYFASKPSVLHQNIYGGALGGPLFIPHLFNRNRQSTFFYVNLQQVQSTVGQVIQGATPTAAMRAGTFPTTGPFATQFLKDPSLPGACNASSQAGCFPKDASGNYQIPASRIDQNALTFINALTPLPNNAANGFNNYLNTNPTVLGQLDAMAKVDHNISSKLRLTGEYFNEGQTQNSPNAASPFPNNYSIRTTNNQLAKVQLTQIFSPVMTNQTSIAMNNYVINYNMGGVSLLSQLPNFHQSLPYSGGYLQNYLPFVTMSGGWPSLGASQFYVFPRATDLEDTVADDWAWQKGKHLLSAGATMLFGTKRQWVTDSSGALTGGSFAFNGQFTNNPVADFLLGDVNAFNQGSNGIRKYIHYPIFSPYIEEQWKATRRLTFTAGLRWFYMPWPTTQAGYTAAFTPDQFNPANAPSVSIAGVITSPSSAYNHTNGIVLNGENGIPLNLTNSHKSYWAPTGGFALDVFGNGRTSLRGGYGITYNRTLGQGCAQGCVGYPTTQSVNLINTGFTNPLGGTVAPPTAFGLSGEDLKNYKMQQIQTYSLSLQQQLGENWLVSIAGAGNLYRNIILSININQPPRVPGYNFSPLLNTGNYANAYFAPYKGYSSIGYNESIGRANWNALEFGVRHPVGNNLYLTAAYTWSHNLDMLGGIQDAYNPQAAYGNSTLNVPHVFTASAIYSLPQLQSSPLWERTLLGGWKYSDMTTVQSGPNQTLGLSLAHTGLATRPNLVQQLTYPKAWRSGYWFSTASFAQPAAGFFGNVGDGTIRGPGVIDFNMAAYKTFTIRERAALEFRAEYFNVFNHANPNGPNTSLGAGTFGKVTSVTDPRIGELALKLSF